MSLEHRLAEEALASAALTVEWLKRLLTRQGNALSAGERLAFAQLLNEKGVLDDAGLLYVRVGVEAELEARFSSGHREPCSCPTCNTDCESCGHPQQCVHGTEEPQK